jgi:uroporphyrinogen-III synthase
MMMAKSTLIIRPQPDADRDVLWLKRYGVPALASPVMRGTALAHALPDPAGYDGVIFTSRHAVDAIWQSPEAAAWVKKPAFVVGTATAAAARDAGFSKLITGNGGGAGLIAPIRQASASFGVATGRLVWPSAVDISFDMAAALPDFDIERVPVYQMVAAAGFTPAITNALDGRKVTAVIAMSPRSIQLFRAAIAAAGQDAVLASISLIAGSNAIASAAGSGWKKVYTAHHPRRSRLMAIAVLRHQRER